MIARVKIKPKIERVRIFKLEPKLRVKLKYNPSQCGTVKQVGGEVSEVKWDDGNKQVFVTNHFLQPAGEEKQ